MIGRRAGGRRPSLWWLAVGLGVALAAGLGGWLVADRIAADPVATPSEQKVLDAGPARLKVAADWARATRPPVLPGLENAPAFTPHAGLTTTVSVALVPADSASLVPAALVEKANGGLPMAEAARVVGLQARAYRGVLTGDSVLDIYAIPTTRGVLTLVCTSRGGSETSPTWCLEGLAQIAVRDARPVLLNDSTAYRMRAPETMKKLDSVRVRERAALRRAEGPVGQKRAALALYRAYGDAAAELTPLGVKGEPSEAVALALRDTARAYRKLSIAADHRSERSWERARTGVSEAERTLELRVAATP